MIRSEAITLKRDQRLLPAQLSDQDKPSIGTIRNWPNEPAAAATPMAQDRFVGI
jgi:hypothetical protein